jgi:hypothetical protein
MSVPRKVRSAPLVAAMLHDDDVASFKARIRRDPDAETWQPAEGCWEVMCQKRTADVDYIAWRHILPDGGTEYLSRTVVEGASAAAMHAFYNHDEMRLKWDGLLADASTIEVRGVCEECGCSTRTVRGVC